MTKEQLEKMYIEAERLAEKYGKDCAYYYLMELIYYRINGEFKEN